MSTETNQLQLPYEEITEVKGRTDLRKQFKISSKEGYKIPFDKLLIRDGFNKRRVYEDMETLVEWVKASTIDGLVDLDPPLTVDVLEDGRVFVLRGHRRHRGIALAIEQGLVVDFIVCVPAGKEVTELDRMVDIYTSNMHQSKLKPVEQAEVCWSLKHLFGEISNEEIAAKLNVSRQKVDYLLLIADAGDDIKNEILNGDMTLTDAVAYIRKQKKLEKQTDNKEEESHKTPVNPSPDPKDELAGDIKELNELEKPSDAENWWNALSPDDKATKVLFVYGANIEVNKEQIENLYEEEQAEEELKKLLEVSDEIKVREETLPQHVGRKLSAAVVREWVHEYEEGGEPQSRDMSETIAEKNTILTEDLVAKITTFGEIDTIFVYKQGMEPVAASVITVAPETEEKGKYDMSREEIKQIQNCIGLADKLEAIVTKLDVPEGSKKDITSIVSWLQKDLADCREYIHKNKKQNKRGI